MAKHISLLIILFTISICNGNGHHEENKFPALRPEIRTKFQNLIEHKDEIVTWMTGSPRVDIPCTVCKFAVDTMISFMQEGNDEATLEEALVNVCIQVQAFPPDVCTGIGANFVPIAHFIYTRKPFLTTDDVCGTLINQDPKCSFVPNGTLVDWDITVDPTKPPLVTPPLLPVDLPSVKILQLTDIHLDLNYIEGSLTEECGNPFQCCNGGMPNSTEDGAGHYGDYNCDFPEDSVNTLFQDAANRYEDYSFVLLTGDFVHHGIWKTSVEENTKHIERIAGSMKEIFKDVPIFPVFGNHEAHPCNMYPPREIWSEPGFDLSWLFNMMADLYADYLPAEALETFRMAGYYTVSPSPDLRLVVLNTNYCYTLNFWLIYNTVDPEGQLQWFADTLLRAEQAGEKVLVVGHIPPGHKECWRPWNEKYIRVINRFEGIIKAQFYGHTHEDDFNIFFDNSTGSPRPSGSLYIGASVTPLTNLNPGYKVYHFDGIENPERNATWEMIDHETYIYNLTEANLSQDDPIMYRLYTAKEAYGLNSLRPDDLYDFVVRMVNDDELFQKFYRYFNKDSDAIGDCDDDECKFKRLCEVVGTDLGDETQCEILKSMKK